MSAPGQELSQAFVRRTITMFMERLTPEERKAARAEFRLLHTPLKGQMRRLGEILEQRTRKT